MAAPPPAVITAPDGSEVTILGSTVEEQQRLIDDQEAEWDAPRALAAFVADFKDAMTSLLGNHWTFLQSYSDQFFTGMNASPGADWPQFPADPDPTTLAQAITWVNRKMIVVRQREEILRSQLSFVTFAQTREARLFRLILAVLAKQIERDPSLVPPPDR